MKRLFLISKKFKVFVICFLIFSFTIGLNKKCFSEENNLTIITNITPDLSNEVNISENIKINFSNELNSSSITSINSTKARIKKISGDIVESTVTYESGNIFHSPRIVINPNQDLEYGTFYLIEISGDILDTFNQEIDGNNNGLAEGSPADDAKFSFQTKVSSTFFDEINAFANEVAENIFENIKICQTQNDAWEFIKENSQDDLIAFKKSYQNELIENGFINPEIRTTENSNIKIQVQGIEYTIKEIKWETSTGNIKHHMAFFNSNQIVTDLALMFKIYFTFLHRYSKFDKEYLEANEDALKLIDILQHIHNALVTIRAAGLNAVLTTPDKVKIEFVKSILESYTSDYPKILLEKYLDIVNELLQIEYQNAINISKNQSYPITDYQDASYYWYTQHALDDELREFVDFTDAYWKEVGNLVNQLEFVLETAKDKLIDDLIDSLTLPELGTVINILKCSLNAKSLIDGLMNDLAFFSEYKGRLKIKKQELIAQLTQVGVYAACCCAAVELFNNPGLISMSLKITDSSGIYDDNMISFGSITLGEVATESFTLENAGEGELLIECWISSDTAFSLTPANPSGSTADVSLQQGESIEVNVEFSPQEINDYKGTITIISNDPQNQFSYLTLTGMGIEKQTGINIPPSFLFLSPLVKNDPAGGDIYQICWLDNDPEDNATIILWYVPLKEEDTYNPSVYDQTQISSPNCNQRKLVRLLPFSEDAEGYDGDSFFWNTASYDNYVQDGAYYIIALISDLHNPGIYKYSPGTIKVEHPTYENNFAIINDIAEDDNSDGDGDGIMESGEGADYKIIIKNESSNTCKLVVGDLTTTSPYVTITDGRVTYGEMSGGSSSDGDDDFNFDTTAGFTGKINFNLKIQYEDAAGKDYLENETLSVTIWADGEAVIELFAGEITIEDTGAHCNGDGQFQSGENIGFFVELLNKGNVLCLNPRGVIGQITIWGSDVLSDREASYPNISTGGSGINSNDFDTFSAPYNFAGPLNMSMEVFYGPDREYSQNVNFTINVHPVPYMNVSPDEYDFGKITPDDIVNKKITIYNYGSKDLTISSVTIDNSDTSIEEAIPIIAPKDTSVECNIIFDPSEIQENSYITRKITFNSDAFTKPSQTVTITGTVIVEELGPSNYTKIWEIEKQSTNCEYNNVVVGDTDNDGNVEIITTTYGTSADYPAYIYIFEKEADDEFQLKWQSAGLNRIRDTHSLALADFDNDGFTDIVALSNSGFESGYNLPYLVHRFEATANDTWISRGVPISDSTDMLLSMATGDSDNDGKLETIVTRYGGSSDDPRVLVYEFNNGAFSNSWTSPRIMNKDNSEEVTGVLAVTVADSDSDGNSEIIFITSSDDPLIHIYERTGDNSYEERLRYVNENYLENSWYDPVDIVVADTDGDAKKEIICTSEAGYLFIMESTGNNSWNTSSPEHYELPNGNTGYCLTVGDVDEDSVYEIVVGMSIDPGLAVYETIADNSHILSWQSTNQEIIDDVFSLALLNVNSSPSKEIIAMIMDENIAVLSHTSSIDIQLVENNIIFEPDNPKENDEVIIKAIVSNLSANSVNQVKTNFYLGDPAAGGIKIGQDQIIDLIPGRSEEPAQVTWQPALKGNYWIFVIVAIDSAESDLTNNKATKKIIVIDDDVDKPTISNIRVEEYNGDNDGLIENDEQVKISWQAIDPSGISTSWCTINGTDHVAAGSYYVILDSSNARDYNFSIYATDGDNSKETSEESDSFTVYIHAPIVIETDPNEGETGVSINPKITANFNVSLKPSSVNETTILVKDSPQNTIAGNVAYDNLLNQVIFQPDSELKNSEEYNVTLVSGAAGIKDENGNEMKTNYSWPFTTEPDTDFPVAAISWPSNGSKVSGTITIKGSVWDRNINYYELYYGVGNTPVDWTLLTGPINGPVLNDSLGNWNTIATGVIDGPHNIKLVAVDSASNVSETKIRVIIENTSPGVHLTVSKSGTGSGTVTSAPVGIDCGTDCQATYDEGTVVILTATPDSGSIFAGWSGGGCSGTGNCELTLNIDTTVTATFGACPTPVTPSGPNPSDGETDVSINTDLDWSDCANTDSYDVYFGTSSSPPYHDNITSSNYNLPPLTQGETYYWQIIAKNTTNGCSENTSGPVWQFTTSVKPYQEVSIDPNVVRVPPCGNFRLTVNYDVTDGNNMLSGLGINIHFDSSKLEYIDYDNYLDKGDLKSPPALTNDTNNEDSDPNTDKVINISWASFSSQWPDAELPAVLAELNFTMNCDLEIGEETWVNITSFEKDVNYAFVGSGAKIIVNLCSFDIDDNGEVKALTDGLLIMRYLFRYPQLYGDGWIDGVVAGDCGRCTAQEVENYIKSLIDNLCLDIDDNGEVKALTDGLFIMRYLFRYPQLYGDEWIDGVVAGDCGRCTAQEVENYISSLINQ